MELKPHILSNLSKNTPQTLYGQDKEIRGERVTLPNTSGRPEKTKCNNPNF
jgi:hypothetical protein